jgi:hypothetical protein
MPDCGLTNCRKAHINTETNYLLEMVSKHRGIIIALFKSRSEAERRRNRVRQLVVRFPPL